MGASTRLPSFYDAVYELVRAIPRGKVVAYGWVASWLGAPRAARAVGYALAACPPSFAPWQRVVNVHGEISVGGDVSRPERQRALLEREGVAFDDAGRIDLGRYAFHPSGRQLAKWCRRSAPASAIASTSPMSYNAGSTYLGRHAMTKDDAHKPPQAVQKACERGLKLKEEGFGGRGLVAKTINWAKHMAAGKEVPTGQNRRMSQWFARHQVDKRPGWDKPPTPGYVAWLLWGGDAGMRWANSMVSRADKDSDGATKKKKGKKKTAARSAASRGKKVTKRTTKKKTGAAKKKKRRTTR